MSSISSTSGNTPQGDFPAPLPLTARQSLLWLDERLFPEARYHNLVLTLELRGALDVPALALAWAAVVEARDALRLVVDERADAQRVLPVFQVELPVVPVAPEALWPWVAERCARSLRGQGVRWDVALLVVGAERHVLYLCVHHLVADGQSLVDLVAELEQRYRGELPEPAPSFAEYLKAEQAYRASPGAKADEAYWARLLEGGATPLRPYGLVRTDRSAALERVWCEASPELSAGLRALAGSEAFVALAPPLSRLLVLATGLVALLYRVSGSREILLGIPHTNRAPRFHRTCGLLMEQIFLKAEVQEGDTFVALAYRLREALFQGIGRGRASVSDRGTEYATLNLMPQLPSRFAGLEATVSIAPTTTLAGDGAGYGDLRDTLGLLAYDFAEGPLRLAFDLHRHTFGPAVRERMRGQLLRVLAALAATPQASLDAVDLLADGERDTVLAATRGCEPADRAPDLLSVLAEQARRRPDAVAVEAPDGRLTYRELDERTNQLARRLRESGVTRESRVGVAVPRGVRELSALLATLKAGGAYVPVDPGHPVERVRVILEDAAPEVLIAPGESPLAAALPRGARLFALDDLAAATAGIDPSPVGLPSEADQLAYILFTSGSTGRPKGVEVLRGAFANFLRSMAHTPGLREGERVLAVTTTTFDIAGLELFLPLWVGGTVVIADRETALDPRRLRERLEREPVSVLQATPATWRLLVDAGWRGDGRIRLFCGGEALSPDLAAALLERCGELWNLYGPTETTVWSTLDRVLPGDARITVGRPIDATQIYVLDPALKLVPMGVVGELYIGGDGLARGYRGRPDLTAERFLPDPYGRPGSRMYRTGDLGRLLEDGRFECLGRVDHQVKIRGFRIELGEIEAALRASTGVKEAVVVAERQGGQEARLLAYWVGEARRQDLFEQAKRKLPPYMVPAGWLRLEKFPLTTSGKIDRKSLPRAETQASAPAELRLPANDQETRVATIWSDVLGVSPIGVDQDFFALGGSSVLAIRAHERIERELGVELALRAFFEVPTVEAMVRRLGKPDSPDDPIVVRLRRGRDGAPALFCLLGVQLYQDLALAMDDQRPVYGIHVPVRYRPGLEPCPRIPEIARRYVEQIRRLQPSGPYSLAGLCFGGIVAFEAARQLLAQGERVPLVVIIDGNGPGAVHIDKARRVIAFARRALAEPRAAAVRLLSAARSLVSRARPPNRAAVPPGAGADQPIDVPIDGRALDDEVARYCRNLERVDAHVLVFRAVGRNWPDWMTFASDLGWGSYAGRITARDLDAGHLSIVRGPNAKAIGHAITEAL